MLRSGVFVAALVAISLFCMLVEGKDALAHADILKAVKQKDMGRLEWLLNEGVNPDYFNDQGDRWTALIHAVNMGSLDFVDRLLRARANPNQVERDGWTALHFAAAYGHIGITRALVEAGADANIKTKAGLTVLDIAREYKKNEVQETIGMALRNKEPAAKIQEAYLANIAAQQNAGMASNIGGDVQLEPMLFKAAENGPMSELVKIIKSKTVNLNAKSPGDGRTALHRAAYAGALDRVRALVEGGAYVNEVDAQSWSALMFAASNAHYDVSQYLLSLGADPFIRNIHGISAYVLAAENGHPEISALITSSGLSQALLVTDETKMLQMLRAGADPDSEGSNGFTSLIHFAGRGNTEAVQEIVRLGADINAAEKDKWTPLMFASFRGDIQIVIYLMNNGADQTMRNKAGHTPLDLAQQEGHSAVVEILKSYRTKNLRAAPRPKGKSNAKDF